MKNFIKNLFGRSEEKETRIVSFQNDIYNFVNVLDTDSKDKKKDDLFSGLIRVVDFRNRIVLVENKAEIHTISFDDIVTISRMRDNRLRMWIKVGGKK